jgi:hypothetical protein
MAESARDEAKVLLAPKAPTSVTKTVKQPRKVVM